MRAIGLKTIGIVFGLLAVVTLSVSAAVKPHVMFGDNMVLQQGMIVPVWGTAANGETVTVEFQGQKVSSKTMNGKWLVNLEELKAGGPFTMTISGNNTVKIENVLVGEVWVCSGQSNMQWSVSNSNNPSEEIANAKYPNIRLFSVPRKVANQPQLTVDGKWEECSPKTVGGFTAVGYFFGRSLHQARNVPVGLIHTSWGGTPAESWASRESLNAESELKYLVEKWDRSVADYDRLLDGYLKKFDVWRENAKKIDAKGNFVPGAPQVPRDPRTQSWRASGLYNAMIAPLIPYAVKGAIWYQGESNAGRAHQYRTLFPTMIQDWRKQWGLSDLTFLFVQLANFKSGGGETWPELREAQTMTLSLPKTGMAVTTDIGHPTDIHPRNKQDVGYRLALAARGVAYGEKIEYSGPMYHSIEKADGRIRVRFNHLGGGLKAKNHAILRGFTIAGMDKEFVTARARIDNDTVLVWSNEVKEPVAVRYAWTNNPEEANLFNKAGLPASSFRTDDWPGITEGKQ